MGDAVISTGGGGSAGRAVADATDIARSIAIGEISAVEAVETAIGAAEAVNPRLNAIIHERYERALAEAAAPLPGPLSGVPIVVKDLDGTLADEPYWAGTDHLKALDFRATETSVLIQRFIDAGAIVIGKTNTPELGLVPSTEPRSTGPTHNPWDLDRSPAGSSGGSAAAVAANIVPIGHAGDGGGSIRLPAAVCGLVGLKPSRGRTPTYPDIDPWGGLVARGAVTRTVRDTALALDVVGGGDPLDSPVVADPNGGDYVSLMNQDPGSLRVSVQTSSADGSPVDPRIVDIVRAAADHLASLGHRVADAAPDGPFTDTEMFAAVTGDFLTVYPVWIADSLDLLSAMSGHEVTAEGVEAHTWELATAGRSVTATSFLASLTNLHQAGRRLRAPFRSDVDVLLTPTVGEIPWTLGQFSPTPDNPLAGVFRSAPVISFATPFNIAGLPAISLPLGWVDGLPIGVQLVAGWGREDRLLQVAGQLELAADWRMRRPPVSA